MYGVVVLIVSKRALSALVQSIRFFYRTFFLCSSSFSYVGLLRFFSIDLSFLVSFFNTETGEKFSFG